MPDLPWTILDTGILIAGLGNRSGLPARALDAAIGGRTLLLSDEILREYAGSLSSARARRHHGLSDAQIATFLDLMRETSRVISPAPGPACPDPRDQHLWDALNAVSRSILVTGEAALLGSHQFPGRVLSPRQFVEGYVSA